MTAHSNRTAADHDSAGPAKVRMLPTVIRFVVSTVVFGAVLFGAAGTLDWPAAWGYLVVMTLILGVYVAIVTRLHPELIDERRHPPADAKRWDRPFVAIVGVVGPVALVLLSGFDRRYHWSARMPGWVQVAGLVAGFGGGMLTNAAVAANRFFSALVRIQHDRGHRVVDTGPYRFVRHPGYTGSLLNMFGMAIALGSRAAIGAVGLIAIVLLVRTALEDRTLRAELQGYEDYAQRVRYRLIPGVW